MTHNLKIYEIKNNNKMEEKIHLIVYVNGTIYLNGYRIKGRKIYVSENVPFKSYKIELSELKESLKNLNIK